MVQSESAAELESRWAALMVSAQGGSEPDYRQLLAELALAIQAYLSRRVGSYHFVEDCVQEALLAIHQARHSYDPRRPFRAWMFAIVRYKAIDCLRRQQRQQKILDHSFAAVQLHGDESTIADPQAEAAQGQLLAALNVKQRQVLLLTKVNGLSVAEAAAQLGVSKVAVKVRVHRAIAQLKRLLEADTP